MSKAEFISELKSYVGQDAVLTSESSTAYYRSGFRSGSGEALAVVFPSTLLEQWQVLKACVREGCAIIMQASKTGLTEGSCPSGSDYDRDVVVINITRIKRIHLLDGGKQIIALPGSTLHELEQELKPLGRAPHSVIGSTMIGATIIGGIANNAGGALAKRGSSYTELALYARVDENGELQLVNELGIDGLGDTPEEIFETLQNGEIPTESLRDFDKLASDRAYADRIRNLDADVPNRYNADPARLHGLSGSAGKVAGFAARVDTYPAPEKTQVFVLGANDTSHFKALRTHILQHFEELPEMCEYMNRGTFDTAEKYGKDVFLSIKRLGTGRMPRLYALKSSIEFTLNKIPFLPKYIPDRVLYYLSQCFPSHLPERLLQFRDKYEHYLILSTADKAIDEARTYLKETWLQNDGCEMFECTPEEQQAALLHRFAAAGAAIRYQNIHQRTTEDVLALDIAMLGSDDRWDDPVPEEVEPQLVQRLIYGHFFCHVFHIDYIFKKGVDTEQVKKTLLDQFKARSAKYPAEHNVGHLYEAGDTLRNFYEQLDPTNTFNPGIGKQSKQKKAPFRVT